MGPELIPRAHPVFGAAFNGERPRYLNPGSSLELGELINAGEFDSDGRWLCRDIRLGLAQVGKRVFSPVFDQLTGADRR